MDETPPVMRSGERIFEIATELLSFDTQNPPGETRAIAGWLESFFEGLGLEAELYYTDPAKPNVVATLPGATDRTLLYNGHLDTVPFERTEWTYDPLGEREGDRLYGRGATDMKGPLASMLYTAEAFVEADIEPPVTLVFAAVSDEETAGDAGVVTLLEKNALNADACVIGETTSTDGRDSITVADRGSIWLTLDATGESAHGSRPMLGENAIDRLWAAITTLRTRLSERTLEIPDEVDPILEESLEYYEPIMGEETTKRLFEHPTINLGTIEGGDAINTVPRTASAQLDIRLSAGVDTSSILADIRDCLRESPGVTIADVSWSVGTYEPTDSPLVKSVTEAVDDVVSDRVYRRSATGGGDAKKFRNAGIPTVDFAFGTDTVHAVDEYTTMDALERNAEVYAQLPSLWRPDQQDVRE